MVHGLVVKDGGGGEGGGGNRKGEERCGCDLQDADDDDDVEDDDDDDDVDEGCCVKKVNSLLLLTVEKSGATIFWALPTCLWSDVSSFDQVFFQPSQVENDRVTDLVKLITYVKGLIIVFSSQA